MGSVDVLDSDLCVFLSQILSHAAPSLHDALERHQLVTALLRFLCPWHEQVIRLNYEIGDAADADLQHRSQVRRDMHAHRYAACHR